MSLALISTNPYAIVAIYPDGPAGSLSFRLPSGDLVEGASIGWSGQGCALVAVAPFVPPAGQQITGAPTYAIDSSGNVTETYATVPIPPSSMQILSTSTPALNGAYAIDPVSQQKVQAISLYIAVNGRFPAGQSQQAWPDMSGSVHLFPTTAAWQAFATAMGDFVAALDLGQMPAQPVTIP